MEFSSQNITFQEMSAIVESINSTIKMVLGEHIFVSTDEKGEIFNYYKSNYEEVIRVNIKQGYVDESVNTIEDYWIAKTKEFIKEVGFCTVEDMRTWGVGIK